MTKSAPALTRQEWKLLAGCSLDYPITRTPSRVPLHQSPTYKSPEGKAMSESCVERLVKAKLIEPVPDDVREAARVGTTVIRYVFTDRGLTVWQAHAAEYDPNLKRKGKGRRHEGARG